MDEEASSGPEYLVSQSTHTCLTVIRGKGIHDAVIGMSKCSGGVKQQWIPKDGQWHWGGDQSLCLSVSKSGKLCLAPRNSLTGTWIHDQEGRLTLGHLALDVPWQDPRKEVILYPKHCGLNQKWWTLSQLKVCLDDCQMTAEHYLAPTILEICKKEINRVTSEKVTNLMQKKDCDSQEKTVLNSSAVFGEPDYLISQSTHTCLTVLGNTSPCSATVGLAPYVGSANQQWYHKDGIWLWGSDPNYCLAPDTHKKNLCLAPKDKENVFWSMDKSGMFINGSQALDVPWEGTRTKVILYPKHGGINQKWWSLSKLKLCIGQKMYPFPTNDEKTYKEELARGILNRLCPLVDPLPHPRDITCYSRTVSLTTPRVEMSCLLKVGVVKQAKNLRITVPQDWQATNIYVAAGDVFTVTLPDTLTEAQADQITVRVGAQCDCLNPTSPNLTNGTFKRMPIISEEFDVGPGVTTLRSQFGGNLIFTYEGEESLEVTAFIKNVIETPHYILGKSSKNDWNRMKRLDSPFSVLETSKVVLIVPTSKARDISNLDNLLHRYDDVVSKLEDLSGFTEEDPPPQGKQWLVDDVQITAGSAHAGFPAMFDNQYYDLTSPKTPHNWVVWHELGHNYQQGEYWSYAYGSESTVNLFSLYIEENLQSDDRLKREDRYAPTMKAVDNGLTFEKADCWQKLVFLMEIKHAFPSHGWNMYRHLNKSVRSLSEQEAKVLRSSQQKQYDYVYRILSLYIGVDLLPHYQRWSLPISKDVQNEISGLCLPKSSRNLLATCQPDKCVIA